MIPTTLHPSIVELLGFFAYEHLPEHLQVISKPFHDLAQKMVDELGVSYHDGYPAGRLKLAGGVGSQTPLFAIHGERLRKSLPS